MKKSVKYFVVFVALLGFGAAPAWAQGKGARGRDDAHGEHSGSKADRGHGGEASADRSNRSRAGRDKNDEDKASSERGTSNKRKR
jgi:hypothetical protein